MIVTKKEYTFSESLKRVFIWVPEAKATFYILLFREVFVQIFGIISFIYLAGIIRIFQYGNIKELSLFLGGYFSLAIFHIIVRWYTTPWGHTTIKHGIENIVTTKVLRTFLGSNRDDIERLGVGRCISIIMRDTNQHVWIGLKLLVQVCSLLVSLVFGGYLFIHLNASVLLIPLVGVVFAIGFSTYRSKVGSHGEQEKLWSVFKEYDRMIARQIMSQGEILQNNSIEQEIKLLKKNSLEYSTIYTKGSYRFAKNYLFTYFILVLLYIGIALYLGYQGNIGYTESLAFVAGIFGFIAFFHSQMLSFVAFFEEFISQYIQVKTGWQLLDSLTPIRGYSTGLSFSPHKKDIIISSITYGYNESKVFSDFSLTLARGKKTALVGASGGGKTTLMKLIAGYLHPESGSISVLGNQLDETALKTYYPHIGYLTQDPGVFDATIRENLVSALTATGDQKNIEQKLEKALRLAQCDFVFELEHGLDTEIGERGVRLSGGQKQRLAIAKIFLKDPEIILLDEPTSALDSFSEEKITEALNILFEGRTVIIVAHRLQTVKRADDIIVIEGGEVVERGNHSELVEKGGIYNRMLELQSGF